MELQDIVFAPNLVHSPHFGNVYQGYMKYPRRAQLEDWTCKKTAKPGDLYLIYFGEPERKIVGLAVCKEFPNPEGQMEGDSKMFFCDFDQICRLKSPVTADELRSAAWAHSWWKTMPYRGRPKTIPRNVAAPLLKMIAKREPAAAPILTEYLYECTTTKESQGWGDQVKAWEGTRYERLSRQASRSTALREAKIREVLAESGSLACEVPNCRFDFFKTYGELGRGFAHVHHRRPLAKRGARDSKLEDLAVVCANCHAMIHKGGQCRPLERLIRS
jgi:hypothetical protein